MTMHLHPLADQPDEALVARYQAGDDRALQVIVERYRRFARAKGRGYFLIGGDSDDVEQEALIGLYKAVRDFRSDREASFRAFAELCITRQIITAIKTATRQKHQPLNQYVSITATRPTDEGEQTVEEVLEHPSSSDPLDELVSGERLARLRTRMAELLSELEVDVLRLYVEGKTYQEIGAQLGRHVKSIDNALQRIKRKLDLHLEEEAALDTAAKASEMALA